MGTVVLPSTSGRPVFQKQKKGSSPTGRKKTPTYGTAHPPTTDDAVHPPPTHRPNLHYIQQYSSAAVRTAVHLVRVEQLDDWFLRTLYETGNKRRDLTILGHLGERASRHRPPPTTHHPPTDLPSTAVQQCSSTWSNTPDKRAAADSLVTMLSGWAGFAIVYSSPPRRGPSEPSPGGRFPRSPLAEVGHRRPFFRRHVVLLLCGLDVAAPRGREAEWSSGVALLGGWC